MSTLEEIFIIQAKDLQIEILRSQIALQNDIIERMRNLLKRKCVRGPEYETAIQTADEILKKWAVK